jgi:hypothetical protein
LQGTQGTLGTQGAEGTQGASGLQGATGTGTQGTEGAQGVQGTTGTQGAQGVQGTTGTGTQGTQGTEGAVADSGWTAVTSFTNSFSGTSVAYRKINNVVYLRGNLTGGTAESTAFNLPADYRPAVDIVIPVQKFGTTDLSYVTVYTNGNVTPNSTAAWLSSIVFPVS